MAKKSMIAKAKRTPKFKVRTVAGVDDFASMRSTCSPSICVVPNVVRGALWPGSNASRHGARQPPALRESATGGVTSCVDVCAIAPCAARHSSASQQRHRIGALGRNRFQFGLVEKPQFAQLAGDLQPSAIAHQHFAAKRADMVALRDLVLERSHQMSGAELLERRLARQKVDDDAQSLEARGEPAQLKTARIGMRGHETSRAQLHTLTPAVSTVNHAMAMLLHARQIRIPEEKDHAKARSSCGTS